MDHDPTDVQRRAVLQISAGLAAAGAAGLASAATGAVPPAATGRAGDFDFLSGEWKIRNRQKKGDAWDEFDSEATVHGILAGIGSVEELRIPARNFSGMGLRLLDLERRLWADYWVNAKSGVLQPPPVWGSFTDGVGTWDSDDDSEPAKPLIVRGVWDQITPRSCRWYQAASRDGGKTWAQSWVMAWTRV